MHATPVAMVAITVPARVYNTLGARKCFYVALLCRCIQCGLRENSIKGSVVWCFLHTLNITFQGGFPDINILSDWLIIIVIFMYKLCTCVYLCTCLYPNIV